jgi:serine/threonine-protein kinase
MHVVHRDVSPQNILVGFDGAVKLIDFGVARAAGRLQQTSTGILKGKYPYMSPEQVDAQEVDHRSDIFALGIVFWEMLSGKRLFKGENDIATMKLVRACDVPPPSTVNPQVPRAFDPVVMRALAREPAARYQDANDLRMAIDALAMASHLPASTSHLVTCMRELFPDHAVQDDATLDELGTGAQLDQVPAAKGTPANASHTRSRYKAQEKAGGSSRLVAGVFGAFVLVAVGLGYYRWTRPAEVQVAQPLLVPAVPPAAVEVKSPRVPAPPAEVLVHLKSKPLGAEVFEASAQLGTTPVDLRLSRDRVHALTLKLKGYAPAERSLDVSRLSDDVMQLEVALDKSPTRHRDEAEVHAFE